MKEPQVPVAGAEGSSEVAIRHSRRLSIAPLAALRPSMDVVRIVGLWAAWLAVICAFQIVVQARVAPQRPDNVLAWTPSETSKAVLDCRPRLADPNMNEHVAFDSEYYISIAVAGYDDPQAEAYANTDSGLFAGVPSCAQGAPEQWTSLNYAFLPGYPMAMRPVIAIEGVLPFTSDLTENGKATLAGIIVSAVGGLLAMLALARLMGSYTRRRKSKSDPAADLETGAWGGLGGIRAALYLLVFPTGFYLAQVYSEGLFVGLAFMACALAVEKKVVTAAVFAALATWVRPAGVFLVFPLAWAAFELFRKGEIRPKDWRIGVPIVAALAPMAAFGAWYLSPLGQKWRAVEDGYFARSFDLVGAWNQWVNVWNSLMTGVDKTMAPGGGYQYYGGGQLSSASMVYLTLELLSLALAVVATVWLIRRMPGVALFGLGVLVLSFGSSAASPQGMDRYVLAVPTIFLMLAWFGRRVVVDRVWVLASTLLMGMLVTLFTFGFWVS